MYEKAIETSPELAHHPYTAVTKWRVISHMTAARIHGLILPSTDVAHIHGVPVTTLQRTLLDIRRQKAGCGS